MWLLGCQGVSILANFAFALILIQGVVTSDYGVFSYGQSVLGMLVVAGELGMRPLIIRQAVRRPQSMGKLLGSYLLVAGASSILAGLAVLAALPWMSQSGGETLFLIFVCLAAVSANLNIWHLFDSVHLQRVPAIVTASCDILALGTLFALAHQSMLNVPLAGLVLLAKHALASSLLGFVWVRGFAEARPHFDGRHAKRLFVKAFPIGMGVVLVAIPVHSAVILTRWMSGEEHAAVMGVAMQFMAIYLVVTMSGLRTVLPHIGAEYGRDRDFLWKLAVFGIAFLTVTALAMSAGAPVAIVYLMPSVYRECIVLTIMCLAAAAIRSFSAALAYYWIVDGLNVQWAIVQGIAVTVFLLVYFALHGLVQLYAIPIAIALSAGTTIMITLYARFPSVRTSRG